MNSHIYFNTVVGKKVALQPFLLKDNFEEKIEEIIKKEYEGICIKEGYVVPNTISIKKRSVGEDSTFLATGVLEFNVAVGMKICNPPKKAVIQVKVDKMNKHAIFSQFGPLMIIVPVEMHKNKKLFDNIKLNEIIDVMVIGKRIKLGRKEISIYGILAKDQNIKISKEELKKSYLKEIKGKKDELEEEQVELDSDDEIASDLDDEEFEEKTDFNELDTKEEVEEEEAPIEDDVGEEEEEMIDEGMEDEIDEEIEDDNSVN